MYDVLVAAGIGVVGLTVVLGPWVYRLTSDLAAERAERVRTQERADLAAHLHDSVLQTLALIQKNAGDSATVARLARSQERDLRAWLFETEPRAAAPCRRPARESARSRTPTASTSSWSVWATATSTTPSPPWSRRPARPPSTPPSTPGARLVDLYSEVRGSAVEVFVRDRGTGFDPDDIPADRQGVRNSIVDRMSRHGGTAEIRSTPGSGTEVRLKMPFQARQETTS